MKKKEEGTADQKDGAKRESSKRRRKRRKKGSKKEKEGRGSARRREKIGAFLIVPFFSTGIAYSTRILAISFSRSGYRNRFDSEERFRSLPNSAGLQQQQILSLPPLRLRRRLLCV